MKRLLICLFLFVIIIPLSSAVSWYDTHGVTLSSTAGSGNLCIGQIINITSNTDIYLDAIYQAAGGIATNWYIINDSEAGTGGDSLCYNMFAASRIIYRGNGTSGGIFNTSSYNITLKSKRQYGILFDANGTSFSFKYANAGGYPKLGNSENITYVKSISTTSLDTTNIRILYALSFSNITWFGLTQKPVINSFTAANSSIINNTQATLNFNVSYATQINLTYNSNNINVTGLTQYNISNLTNSTTFTLSAKNENGTTTSVVTITTYRHFPNNFTWHFENSLEDEGKYYTFTTNGTFTEDGPIQGNYTQPAYIAGYGGTTGLYFKETGANPNAQGDGIILQNTSFTTGENLGFMYWISPNNSNDNTHFIYVDGFRNKGIYADVSGGYFRVYVTTFGVLSYVINPGLILANNTWHRIGITYNGSNLSAYVNGSFVGSVAATGNGTTFLLNSGLFIPYPHTDSPYLTAKLDRFTLTTYTPSADQINQDYNESYVPPRTELNPFLLNGSMTPSFGYNNGSWTITELFCSFSFNNISNTTAVLNWTRNGVFFNNTDYGIIYNNTEYNGTYPGTSIYPNNNISCIMTLNTTNNIKYYTNSIIITNYAPNITSYNPTNTTLSVLENETISFNATALDDTSTGFFNWFLDGVLQEVSNFWNWLTGFGDAGIHEVLLKVNDSYDISSNMTWNVTVTNVNLPPAVELLYSPSSQSYVNYPPFYIVCNASDDTYGTSAIDMEIYYKNGLFWTQLTESFDTLNDYWIAVFDPSIGLGTYSFRCRAYDGQDYSDYAYLNDYLTVSEAAYPPTSPVTVSPNTGDYDYGLLVSCMGGSTQNTGAKLYYETHFNHNGTWTVLFNNTFGQGVFDMTKINYGESVDFKCRTLDTAGLNSSFVNPLGNITRVRGNNFFIYDPAPLSYYFSNSPHQFGMRGDLNNIPGVRYKSVFMDCNGDNLWDYLVDNTTGWKNIDSSNITQFTEYFWCVFPVGEVNLEGGTDIMRTGDTWPDEFSACQSVSGDTCRLTKRYTIKVIK